VADRAAAITTAAGHIERDADDEARAHALEAHPRARESIYFETYLWKDDAIGRDFKDLLTTKAEEATATIHIPGPRRFREAKNAETAEIKKTPPAIRVTDNPLVACSRPKP